VVDAVQAGKDGAKGILEFIGMWKAEVEPVYNNSVIALKE
jgi:hypothetical protein